MSDPKMQQLVQATHAIYLREFEKIKAILQEESSVRGALAKLDQHDAQTREANPTMQALGADLAWRGWIERKKRELNIELAQIMARKLNAMDKVRGAFGRKHAVQKLIEAEEAKLKKKAQLKAFERLAERF